MFKPNFSKLKHRGYKFCLSGKNGAPKSNEHFNNHLRTQKGSKTAWNKPKITISEVHGQCFSKELPCRIVCNPPLSLFEPVGWICEGSIYTHITIRSTNFLRSSNFEGPKKGRGAPLSLRESDFSLSSFYYVNSIK